MLSRQNSDIFLGPKMWKFSTGVLGHMKTVRDSTAFNLAHQWKPNMGFFAQNDKKRYILLGSTQHVYTDNRKLHSSVQICISSCENLFI